MRPMVSPLFMITVPPLVTSILLSILMYWDCSDLLSIPPTIPLNMCVGTRYMVEYNDMLLLLEASLVLFFHKPCRDRGQDGVQD